MMEHDLGYYVWQLLKEEEETSLFPELFAIFKANSRYELLRSLPFDPVFPEAVRRVAELYGADSEELENAVNDLFDVLAEGMEDDRFKLFWEFVYYFGDTRLDIPHRNVFFSIIQRASVYYRVVSGGKTEEAIKEVAEAYGFNTDQVRRIVESVDKTVAKFEAMGA